MLSNLSEDIVGTNPVYPKIVNQGWLAVGKEEYDNYPSDNNPVRVIPKLSEMWNHGDTGFSLTPNLKVMPLGGVTAEESKVPEIVREAKKVMMMGKTGKGVSEHLRARYSLATIATAKDELAKLASEQGLLGNVYIDASAFITYKEAKQFLTQYRNRLARTIVAKDSCLNPSVLSMLASEFRKDIVSEVSYDQELFNQYKMHLAASGKIPADSIIDSKDSLRVAFLYKKEEPVKVAKKSIEKKPTEEEVQNLACELEKNKKKAAKEIFEVTTLSVVRPILSFAQKSLSMGKDFSGLKEMLRTKYAACDLEKAAPYFKIMASEKGFSSENIDELVKANEISEKIGSELKKIGKEFPIKATQFIETKEQKMSGVRGYLFALQGKTSEDNLDSYRKASLTALKSGIEPSKMKAKLLTKMSNTEADKVLSDSVAALNSISSGMKANAPRKNNKKVIIEDPEPMENLAYDKAHILKDQSEFVNMFADCNSNEVEIDPIPQSSTVNVDMRNSTSGIDGGL